MQRRWNCKLHAPVDKLIGDALVEVAPSMLLTSLTQIVILMLGMVATSGVKQKVTVHTRTYVHTYIYN